MPLNSLSDLPVGVRLVCWSEMLQRFAYFGGRGILLLALTAAVADYGFGWSDAEALRFFGLFVSLYLATPVLGGIFADARIGAQRSASAGAAMMATGYVLVALAASLPSVFSLLGIPLREIVAAAGLPLADVRSVVTAGLLTAAAVNSAVDTGTITFADTAVTLLFYTGFAGIVIGNGLYQSSVMSLIGKCYRDDDPKRNAGFTYQYMAISLGGLVGGLVVGTVGEVGAWYYGFIVAAAPPVLGAVAFALLRRRAFGEVGAAPAPGKRVVLEPFSPHERARVRVIAVMAAFALIYTIAYEQFSGVIAFYAQDSTDRRIGHFEVPASWFSQLASLFGLILGAWYIAFSRWLESRGRVISMPGRFAIGMAMTVLPFALMIAATAEAASAGKSSMLWLVTAYFVLTLAEIFIWPAGYTLAASLAPRRLQTVSLGAWLLIGASLGSWLAAETGVWFLGVGLAEGFALIIASLLAATALIVLLRRWLIANARDPVFAGTSPPMAPLPSNQGA